MKTIILLSTLMIASVIGLAGLARFKQEGASEKNTFRVVYDLVIKKPDGSFQLQGRKVRYVNKDGRMKEISYTPEGQEVYFKLNSFEGSFIGLTDRQIISPMGAFQKPSVETDEILSKVSSGTGSILGYKAYIRKTSDGFNEVWSSPQVPNAPLKTVFYNKGGPGYTAREAVAIFWENVPDAVFTKPNWRIDTFYLEDQIKVFEYNKRDPGEFKRELEKWKAKQ